MTCIAAVVREGTVWMGCDSFSGSSGFTIPQRNSKVFRHGDLLVGLAGQGRAGQIIEHLVTPPPRAALQGTFGYLVRDWVPAVREALQEHGHQRVNEGADEMNGCFLIGASDGLFFLGGDFAIDALGDYAAIGSGEDVAMGALEVLAGQAQVAPDAAVRRALEVASRYISTVCEPFWVEKLGPST